MTLLRGEMLETERGTSFMQGLNVLTIQNCKVLVHHWLYRLDEERHPDKAEGVLFEGDCSSMLTPPNTAICVAVYPREGRKVVGGKSSPLSPTRWSRGHANAGCLLFNPSSFIRIRTWQLLRYIGKFPVAFLTKGTWDMV